MDPINSALSSSLSNSLAQLVDKAFQAVVSGSREGANSVAAKLQVGFEKYIATTRSRCNSVKTLISTSTPVLLDKAYEPVDLEYGNITIPIDDFISRISSIGNRALITATLGSGKSFTMRYIYSQFSQPGVLSHIPIFIELRDVPFSEKSLVSYIYDILQPFTNFVSERSIIAGLKSGAFCLLLDGLDEVSSKNIREADKQINRIAAEYPNNIIIVSSRPDRPRFISWHNFPEYQVSGLTLVKLENLINRIDFDETEKALFITKARKQLYRTHEQILSNPLLASMMLLTFKEFQDIPSKMHVFYGIAFDVLYRRHDTIKTDFQREFKSGLDLNDFKRVFMTLCFMAFLDRKFNFKVDTFKSYIRKAVAYEELEADADLVYKDLNHNICIVHTEGDDVNFIHRSFQEYFSALFLSKRSIDRSYDYIDAFFSEQGTEEFISMLVEIDKEEFERKYLIRRLAEIEKSLFEAKNLKQKVESFCAIYVIAVVDSPSLNSDIIEKAILVPVGLRGLKHAAGPVNNTANVISYIGPIYGINIYYTGTYAKPDWNVVVSEQFPNSHVNVLTSSKISAKIAKTAGLDTYFRDLSASIRRVNRNLVERHAKKTRVLSDALRKISSRNA